MILDFNKFIKNISEKVLNHNQLNLFDDAFSSKTIANTFINQYKCAPIVNKKSEIKTLRDALNYMDDPDNLDETMKQRLLANDSDAEEFLTISTDIISKTIKNLPATEIRDIMVYFSDELKRGDAYNVFTDDDDEVLPLAEFMDMHSEVSADYMGMNRVAEDLADLIDSEGKRSKDELENFFTSIIVDRMVQTELNENFLDNINTDYKDELISALYDQDLDGNRFEIYRSVTLPVTASEIKARTGIRKGVGIFWSYDSEATEAYWAEHSDYGNFELVLHGSVNVANVDWVETYYKSLWNLSMEKEVELMGGYTIQIIGYTLKCDNLDAMRKKLADYYHSLNMPATQLDSILKSLDKMEYVKLPRPITVKI